MLRKCSNTRAPRIIGQSRALAAVLKDVELIAPLEIGVLITGPPGTGKTQLARFIHESSPRCAAVFQAINCASLPDGLVESELFGALPGSASGVTQKMDGKIGAATGGTLFLDEIGELRYEAQAKLLHFLESHEYFPLGATRAVTADVRVIAATNADLEGAVRARTFRADLWSRLRAFELRMPSLAERRDDIGSLASHLVSRSVELHRLARVVLGSSAIEALEACDWPGNVRELSQCVERGSIRAAGEGRHEIEPRHLFPEERACNERPPACAEFAGTGFRERVRRFQEELVRGALEDEGGNHAAAAQRLGISRAHVYNLTRGRNQGRS